ncbi:MAG: hypothetical protein G01um10143_453 [Parcubacteria group bacterium Gr01-1014_3]|nr:MAG: hypothetical protein G01um10143_453 [Parcubacteria group bacterium Gr01-1014_3]
MLTLNTPLFRLLDAFCKWWDGVSPYYWEAVFIYIVFFMMLEMLIHEMGHFYFQRKFGVGVRFLKFGFLNLYSRVLSNGTRLILGIPTLMAESRSVGELGDSEDEKNRADAFYYPRRHPRERFIIAIAGPLAVLIPCLVIWLGYQTLKAISGIEAPLSLVLAFSLVVFQNLVNLMIPVRFGKKYATDAWIAVEGLIDWYRMNKKPCFN